MNKNLKIGLIILLLFFLGIPQAVFSWIRSLTGMASTMPTAGINTPAAGVLSRSSTSVTGIWNTPRVMSNNAVVSRKPASLWSPNS